jgi:hypothetical protein
MIKAVLRGGLVYPLESLPLDWVEGKELLVEEADVPPPQTTEEITKWRRELDAAAAQLNDPSEWEAIEATMAEADRQGKALVRREMGLP